MDELALKRINNAIKQFDQRPINTKYLTTFIFPKDPLVTQKSVEKYLLSKEFVKISDNYMFYFEDLIKYCEKNEINNINKFKSNIFIDFGVSNITLTDDDLSLILNNKRIQRQTFPLTYPVEEDLDNKIVVKTLSGTYVIRNRGELIKFGLTNTYISFDLLKEYCMLFPKESQFEIRYLLDDRGIKLTSDEIEFETYTISKLAKVAEVKAEDKNYDANGETKNENLSIYKSNKDINRDINIDNKRVFINLRLNEILATFINISNENKRISYSSSKKNYLSKHLSEFEKIDLLKKERKKKGGYIISDECMEISTKLRSLVKVQPNKNLFMDKSIMTQENIELFFDYIREEFLTILSKFINFRFLIRLVNEMDAFGIFNIMDMLKYCIVNNYENEFIRTFLGKKGTAGKEAIIKGVDICCLGINTIGNHKTKCSQCYKKHGINPVNLIDKLLYVRNVTAAEEYVKIEMDINNLKDLIEDPLTLKFLVRFGATYYNKNILKALKILKSDVYMKSTGEYCPYNDEWRVYNNEI